MTKYVAGYTGPMLPAAPPRDKVMTPTIGSPGMGRGPRGPMGRGMGRGPMMPVMEPTRYLPPSAPTRMKKGGKVKSASARADGCAVKGKTKGRFV